MIWRDIKGHGIINGCHENIDMMEYAPDVESAQKQEEVATAYNAKEKRLQIGIKTIEIDTCSMVEKGTEETKKKSLITTEENVSVAEKRLTNSLRLTTNMEEEIKIEKSIKSKDGSLLKKGDTPTSIKSSVTTATAQKDIMDIAHTPLQWRDVRGYEGRYQVSNEGQVKSLERTVPGPHGREFRVRERILKPCMHFKGYHVVFLHRQEGFDRKLFVHRLVAEAFVPNTEGKPLVDHKDRDRVNNLASNLEWVTAKENHHINHDNTPF